MLRMKGVFSPSFQHVIICLLLLRRLTNNTIFTFFWFYFFVIHFKHANLLCFFFSFLEKIKETKEIQGQSPPVPIRVRSGGRNAQHDCPVPAPPPMQRRSYLLFALLRDTAYSLIFVFWLRLPALFFRSLNYRFMSACKYVVGLVIFSFSSRFLAPCSLLNPCSFTARTMVRQ